MYYTLVTKYLSTGQVKGYSHYEADSAIAELNTYKDSKRTLDCIIITDEFYAGNNIDMSAFTGKEF